MIAANPGLGEAEIASRIKRSARAFPVDSNPLLCPAIDGDGQCNCTTITCGAGMLIASAAGPQPLDAGAQNPSVVISVPASPRAGTAFTLGSEQSQAALGAGLSTWEWSQLSAPPARWAPTPPSTTFTAPAAGTYILRLTVNRTAPAEPVCRMFPSSSRPPPAARAAKGGGGATDLASLATLLALALLAAGRRLLR